jgi:hypothetical protein
MSRWFRHYAGMMRDDKLVRVAIRSGQTIERVVWIWGAILESAAEIDDGGRFDVDAAEVAYFLRADISDVDAVLGALEVSGRIGAGAVVKWSDRQFQSDRSAERQRRYRDKKRNGDDNDHPPSGNDGVTSPSRHRDAPEAETETNTEKKDANASSSASLEVDQAFSAWDMAAEQAEWPKVQKRSDPRRKALRSILKEYGPDGWRGALAKACSSPVVGARPPPTWFNFDWIIKPANFLKLIEGNYDRSWQSNSVTGIGKTESAANSLRADIAHLRRERGFGTG